MESTEVNQHCEDLHKLVDSGPGNDPEALRGSLAIVAMLERTAPPNLRGRLVSLRGNLAPWFSARRWHTDADVDGRLLRGLLFEDIQVVRSHWRR